MLSSLTFSQTFLAQSLILTSLECSASIFDLFLKLHYLIQNISKGDWTVIIRVITKSRESGCLARVLLQTTLDDTKVLLPINRLSL